MYRSITVVCILLSLAAVLTLLYFHKSGGIQPDTKDATLNQWISSEDEFGSHQWSVIDDILSSDNVESDKKVLALLAIKSQVKKHPSSLTDQRSFYFANAFMFGETPSLRHAGLLGIIEAPSFDSRARMEFVLIALRRRPLAGTDYRCFDVALWAIEKYDYVELIPEVEELSNSREGYVKEEASRFLASYNDR